jgi:Choice-of-anchor I domain
MKTIIIIAFVLCLVMCGSAKADWTIDYFSEQKFASSAAVSVLHDSTGSRQRLYVGTSDNFIYQLDISDPKNIVVEDKVDVGAATDGNNPRSIQFRERDGVIFLVANAFRSPEGYFAAYQTHDSGAPTLIFSRQWSSQSAQLALSPDGNTVVIGRPNAPNFEDDVDDYEDLEGMIVIVDVSRSDLANINEDDVKTLTFSAFNSDDNLAAERGILLLQNLNRPSGAPLATNAQILEPSTPVFRDNDSNDVYVTLRTNNAMAHVRLGSNPRIESLKSLGLVNRDDAGLDTSDKDGGVLIREWQNLYSARQPVSTMAVGDRFVTTNNRPTRSVEQMGQIVPAGSFDAAVFDANAFPDAATNVLPDDKLGKLDVIVDAGKNADGKYEELWTPGARSFTVFDRDFDVRFESGGDLEQIVADQQPTYFNSIEDDNDSFDEASKDEGPSPNFAAVGELDGHKWLFVTLDNMGATVMFDFEDSDKPKFHTYSNRRDFTVSDMAQSRAAGPGQTLFIDADDSPNGEALFVVTYSNSFNVVIYNFVGENPNSAATLGDFSLATLLLFVIMASIF